MEHLILHRECYTDSYLAKEEAVEEAVLLQLHVEEDERLNGVIISPPEEVGEVLLTPPVENISGSLSADKDSGERPTDPGVMFGSSSMDFIWLP